MALKWSCSSLSRMRRKLASSGMEKASHCIGGRTNGGGEREGSREMSEEREKEREGKNELVTNLQTSIEETLKLCNLGNVHVL